MKSSISFPYSDILEKRNKELEGLKSFLLYPGMTFGSNIKWWPDKGVRPTHHEGIDFCYYIDAGGREKYITPEFRVPVMASGKVFTLCSDYLGDTVFLDHGLQGVRRFLSVYAHIVPIAGLNPGDNLEPGDLVGYVADTTGRKNRMPAHLHISLMYVDSSAKAEELDWNMICFSERVELLDPLIILPPEKIKMQSRNHWKEAQGFSTL